MEKAKYFKAKTGPVALPAYFPDATRAVLKTLDSVDIKNTKTPGVLVNTYHLYRELGRKVVESHGDIRQFMAWDGAVISDSGGFQILTLAKTASKKGSVSDKGVIFRPGRAKKILFTPEKSIQFQMVLKPDMVVVLDDFTQPRADFKTAKETVDRSVLWAKRAKKEFLKICQKEKLSEKDQPAIMAVVQGGDFLDLRAECAQRLAEIGFDGFGYGGWPLTPEGEFNYEVAECIIKNSPKDSFFFGLGIGKPEEIVGCVDIGFNMFDCVLPTRDARHKRLYVYQASSIEKINLRKSKFYSFFTPDKERYYHDSQPVSKACDCLLCTKYSRAYLAHLFRIEDSTAMRLATIHNLRFYSLLMEKVRKEVSR
ncbi:MAG TPA: tRNA guanosine(34) transglycosylase Tgt [Candidatus Bathyarchaeia archaeon]|nr:tRNA guanosine(34) transglycosylase Tgt [Candidatus Bathyarchaeia archaeon]